MAGDRHLVSANASETRAAKLLAVFVVDTNETELTTPFGKTLFRPVTRCDRFGLG